MIIDLRKTMRSLDRCLPENELPTLQQLIQLYDRTLRLRSQLLSVIYDRETFGQANPQESLARQRSDGANDEKAVTLIFHEPLPAMKELTAAVEEHWLVMMQAAISTAQQETPLPYFEKAFVQIEITVPRGSNLTRVWDTSNRAINLIINNLKGVFFLDDDAEHMAFGMVGRWGEVGATIVRILDFDQLQQTGLTDFLGLDGKTMDF